MNVNIVHKKVHALCYECSLPGLCAVAADFDFSLQFACYAVNNILYGMHSSIDLLTSMNKNERYFVSHRFTFECFVLNFRINC